MATTKKKAPTKKRTTTTAKKKVSRKKSAGEGPSFRVTQESIPFYTFQFTRQTVYWIILMLIVAILQLWIVKLQLDVANLTELVTSSIDL